MIQAIGLEEIRARVQSISLAEPMTVFAVRLVRGASHGEMVVKADGTVLEGPEWDTEEAAGEEDEKSEEEEEDARAPQEQDGKKDAQSPKNGQDDKRD